jgi:prophage antirepressor-like protein
MQEKVMTTDTITLHYQRTRFDALHLDGEIWLGVSQIYLPLGYMHPNQVTRLYNNRRDEFTEADTRLVIVETAGGPQMVRVFSRRGCLLLCMLARTEPAKEFRAWVLDLLIHGAGIKPVRAIGPVHAIDPATVPLVQEALTKMREAAALQNAAKRRADAIRREARALAAGAGCAADVLKLLWKREREAEKKLLQPTLPLLEG